MNTETTGGRSAESVKGPGGALPREFPSSGASANDPPSVSADLNSHGGKVRLGGSTIERECPGCGDAHEGAHPLCPPCRRHDCAHCLAEFHSDDLDERLCGECDGKAWRRELAAEAEREER